MKLLKVAISAAALALATMPALAQAPSTLRIGLQEDPDMLDPHKARTFVGRIVFMGLCDRLVDITPELKLVPRLATEWNFSADGLTLTMKLRSDAKFHDGETFNAEAAKANLERARTLPDSLRKAELASVDSIEAPDATTLVIKLKRPDATLLSQLTDRAGMMLSPKTLSGDVAAKPVCSGPTNSSSASRTTGSCWRSFESTGRPTSTISTACSTARSPTRRSASPICARASSTCWSDWRRPT